MSGAAGWTSPALMKEHIVSRRAISTAINLIAAGAATVVVWSTAPRVMAADDLWQRTRAMYGALRSYADTGVVVWEQTATYKDQHRFTTYFSRAPRRYFYLDVHKYLDVRNVASKRFVIWADPDAFHAWSSASGEQDDFPNPNNAPALAHSERETQGAGSKIPTLLYSKAQLGGDFLNFADGVVDGTESVNGHNCHRLTGTARDVYAATGKEVNIRKMTISIDAESLLIRKVVEQWKPLAGGLSRLTTTYEPQANPTIEESRFRFVPPVSR